MATAKIPEGFTKEDLDDLTEEELAGLTDDSVLDEGDETDDGAGAGDPGDAGDGGANDDEKKPDDKSGDAGEAGDGDDEAGKAAAEEAARVAAEAAAAAAKNAPDDAAARAAAEAASSAIARPTSALPSYKVPDNAKEQLEALKQQINDIEKKFDEGELTAVERRDQLTVLEDKRDGLKNQLFKASLSYDSLVSSYLNNTVPTFLKDHPQYAKGMPLHTVLDAKVKELQQDADDPFDPAILTTAHDAIDTALRASLNLAPADKKPAAQNGKKAGDNLPPNLGGLPNADIIDDAGGEFAVLDRLSDNDPDAYQNALEKLERTNPTKYEEYMQR